MWINRQNVVKLTVHNIKDVWVICAQKEITKTLQRYIIVTNYETCSSFFPFSDKSCVVLL